jgi:pseudouridine-5'-phosphate glycosidase
VRGRGEARGRDRLRDGGPIEIRPEVREQLERGGAVVALESTVIVHGLPAPHNLECAARMDAAVREGGAVPALVAVLDGRICVGLGPEEVAALARGPRIPKASTRDLAVLSAAGGSGATTVAATAFVARRTGIAVMATGGIGGVHRGTGRRLDISADILELGRTSVAVVCSGAKAILDLPATLEALEAAGVAVAGYGTDEFPAFYARESGLRLEHRIDSPAEAARLIRRLGELGLSGGVLLCNPPPRGSALPGQQVEAMVEAAVKAAEQAGIHGKAVTPFLLGRIAEQTAGRAVKANRALLEQNARLAGLIASACASAEEGQLAG